MVENFSGDPSAAGGGGAGAGLGVDHGGGGAAVQGVELLLGAAA